MIPHSVSRFLQQRDFGNLYRNLPVDGLKVIKYARLENFSVRHFSNFALLRSLREKELLIRKLEQYRGGQDDDGAGHDHDGDADEATCKSFYQKL